MSATELVLVRHGETDWNRAGRLQGHVDTPLNDEGRRQARAAARGLAESLAAPAARDRAAIAVVSSDLARCRQTAEPIGEVLGVPVALDARLRERRWGAFEGRTHAELRTDDPAGYARWSSREPDFAAEGGETLRAFAARIGDALLALAAAHRGATLVVVTHGGVLDVACRLARGLALDAPRDFEVRNASLNRLRCSGGRLELVAWGAVPYGPGVLDDAGVARAAAATGIHYNRGTRATGD